jgi:hypothetical protein
MSNAKGKNSVSTGMVKKLNLQTPRSKALLEKERNVTTLEQLKKQHWRDTDIQHPTTGFMYWACLPDNPTLRCY